MMQDTVLLGTWIVDALLNDQTTNATQSLQPWLATWNLKLSKRLENSKLRELTESQTPPKAADET